MMKNLMKNFIKCGITGWCLEIIFTALHSLQKRELQLMGQTSLWMFPIYGSACFLSPIFKLLRSAPTVIRGSVYALSIFTGEYISGCLLSKNELCPWNYRRSRWHIKEIVRLDYFLNWFFVGLLFERLLRSDGIHSPHSK